MNTVTAILKEVHPEDTFVVRAQFVSLNEIKGRRRKLSDHRRLQDEIVTGLEVSLKLFLETRSGTQYTDAILRDSIEQAFDTNTEEVAFLTALGQLDEAAFGPINGMNVIIDNTPVVVQPEGQSAWVIIIIGSSIAVVAVAAFLYIVQRRRRRYPDPEISNDDSGSIRGGPSGE